MATMGAAGVLGSRHGGGCSAEQRARAAFIDLEAGDNGVVQLAGVVGRRVVGFAGGPCADWAAR